MIPEDVLVLARQLNDDPDTYRAAETVDDDEKTEVVLALAAAVVDLQEELEQEQHRHDEELAGVSLRAERAVPSDWYLYNLRRAQQPLPPGWRQ